MEISEIIRTLVQNPDADINIDAHIGGSDMFKRLMVKVVDEPFEDKEAQQVRIETMHLLATAYIKQLIKWAVPFESDPVKLAPNRNYNYDADGWFPDTTLQKFNEQMFWFSRQDEAFVIANQDYSFWQGFIEAITKQSQH